MTWQLAAAAFVGGLAGAATRDATAAIRRSDWLFWLGIRSDLRTIGRAQRRKNRGEGTRRTPRRNA